MSGVLAASCCCGGFIPPGNSNCVPVCGKLDGQFTMTASTAGYVYGNWSGFSTYTGCLNGCTPTSTYKLRQWNSYSNSIGPYKGRYFLDGNYDSATCDACDPIDYEWNWSGGSWTVNAQRNPSTGQYGIVSQSATFNAPWLIQLGAIYCSQLPPPELPPFCNDGRCGTGTGLYDLIIVQMIGNNDDGPFYDGWDSANPCQADPFSEVYARARWDLRAIFAKPVPFASCRNLTGTYFRYSAQISIPTNMCMSYSQGRIGGYSPLAATLQYAVPPYPNICDATGTPAQDGFSGCLCLGQNSFGYTIPSSITVA